MGGLRFGAWERTPLGAAIETEDTGGSLPAPTFKPSVEARGAGSFRARGPELTLLGPGGVVGIDRGAVVRTDPPAGTGDAQDNYLASIEFSSTELPWLLTPAREDARHRLRPWIVLVVVNASAPVAPGRPLPSIQVSADELPDLVDSWAWAHVQYPGEDAELPPGIEVSVGQAVSRLVCPRRLEPNTHYRACVVPAFAGGVAAGLGQAGEATRSTAPAWRIDQAEPVTLPVYYGWEFATGFEGDFEQLVRRLAPASVEELSAVGGLTVDLSRPWPGQEPLTPGGAPQTVTMRGALMTLAEPQAGTVTEEALVAFANRLVSELNAPADRIAGSHDPDDATGAVAAPLYGGRHVNRERVLEDEPEWLIALNLDPAKRVAAGIGAEYVRRNQEELMARAWEQVGAIREANRRRAMAELATEVSARAHDRHVATLAPGALVALTSPAAARTRTLPEGPPLAMVVAVSPLPSTAASASFARLLRPDGPLAKRAEVGVDSVVSRGLRGTVGVSDPEPLLARFAPSALPAASDTPIAAATTQALVAEDAGALARQVVFMDAVATVARVNGLESSAAMIQRGVASIPGLDTEAVLSFDVKTLQDSFMPHLAEVAEATAVVDSLVGEATPDGRVVDEFGVQIEAEELRGRLVDALAPGDRIARRMHTGVAVPGAEPTELDPVMRYPSFPLPTSLALLATDREWFLPGIGAFPGNRTTMLAVNTPFIAAFLAGLNHEMMRELLWREFPTDRRGSPFRRFWPRPDGADDIPPLDAWTGDLGEQLTLQAFGVLLVRGDVVRRFPDMVVAAAPAATPQQPNPDQGTWRAPLFALPVDPSTAAYAFDLDPEQLTDPGGGFFIVFQEHGYRIRFGFDLSNDSFDSWSDLDWQTVPQARGFAVAAAPIESLPQDPGDKAWNSDAADIARITLQQPFRVAIHASRLVGALE